MLSKVLLFSSGMSQVIAFHAFLAAMNSLAIIVFCLPGLFHFIFPSDLTNKLYAVNSKFGFFLPVIYSMHHIYLLLCPGRLIWVRHNRHKNSATHSYQ